ncbi:alpha/beta hydrolase [Algoriphagus marincola]|uniref:alpha/beta hydrolase n=1 Tax=Algoriphagus marincola TaxID=264027 RepID=UPI00040355BA|nr:alpha/beta hydrolase [Algoriphagus marincola]
MKSVSFVILIQKKSSTLFNASSYNYCRKKMMVLGLIFFISVIPGAIGQTFTAESLGFEVDSIMDDSLGKIKYYSIGNKENPTLLYLDGSGSFPLFQYVPKGIGSTVVIDWQRLKENYRIVLISKPNIPFIDSVQYNSNGTPFYDSPSDYNKMLSADWRINSADLVLNRILESSSLKSPVVLMGFSEGAQVAANLAAKNKNVTHLMLFSGNGIDQLFSEVINQRIQAERGQISHQTAQDMIDSLYHVFNEIWTAPKETEKSWYGHTYQRWYSFSKFPPLDALLNLEIPIYFAVGSRDINPILSADYIKFQFLKFGKQNLTYKVYPDHDHMFNHIQFTAEKKPIVNSNLNTVLLDAFKWLEERL